MRKIDALMVVVVLMILSVGTAFAKEEENMMGVMLISGPDGEDAQLVSLDDIQLNKEIEIDNYGVILPTEFKYTNVLAVYKEGAYNKNFSSHYTIRNSGNEADYALLKMDITNLMTVAHDFLEECEITVVYDEKYEYGGWCYQFDSDNEDGLNTAVNKADEFSIFSMYKGHYVFGCTLPNAVIESDKSLQMIIKLDDNEIIYNIRK